MKPRRSSFPRPFLAPLLQPVRQPLGQSSRGLGRGLLSSVGVLGLVVAAGAAGCGSGASYTPASIESLTPATGPSTGGPLVRITGQNFVTGDLVSFAGEPVPGSMVLSPTEIAVPLPPHPGAFGPTPVSVTHPDGQAAIRGDLFTYYLGSLQLSSRSVSAGQGRPFTVRAGDLNADGIPDLVTGNIGDGKLSVLLGQPRGGFLPPRNFVAGQQPVDTAIADFNGDGKLDVAIADRTGRGINVLIGDGQGGFPAGYRSAVSGSPLSLAVGDATGDSAAAAPSYSRPPRAMCAAWVPKTTLHVARFPAKMTGCDVRSVMCGYPQICRRQTASRWMRSRRRLSNTALHRVIR
jgi:hypothetical protein